MKNGANLFVELIAKYAIELMKKVRLKKPNYIDHKFEILYRVVYPTFAGIF